MGRTINNFGVQRAIRAVDDTSLVVEDDRYSKIIFPTEWTGESGVLCDVPIDM